MKYETPEYLNKHTLFQCAVAVMCIPFELLQMKQLFAKLLDMFV
jgi:hypothetical protein